jgi:hypothetical protein
LSKTSMGLVVVSTVVTSWAVPRRAVMPGCGRRVSARRRKAGGRDRGLPLA